MQLLQDRWGISRQITPRVLHSHDAVAIAAVTTLKNDYLDLRRCIDKDCGRESITDDHETGVRLGGDVASSSVRPTCGLFTHPDTSGGSSVFIQRGVLETTFDLTAIQFRVAVGVGA